MKNKNNYQNVCIIKKIDVGKSILNIKIYTEQIHICHSIIFFSFDVRFKKNRIDFICIIF